MWNSHSSRKKYVYSNSNTYFMPCNAFKTLTRTQFPFRFQRINHFSNSHWGMRRRKTSKPRTFFPFVDTSCGDLFAFTLAALISSQRISHSLRHENLLAICMKKSTNHAIVISVHINRNNNNEIEQMRFFSGIMNAHTNKRSISWAG